MSDLKAIETNFRGYRMRSRTEARWAVVFDRLGIRWEYESQGFDLDGTKYLPDFWLPDCHVFVEVKPLVQPIERCLSIYMAGKIGREDWRHDLVDNLSGAREDEEPLDLFHGGVYAGPFFRDGGHGSAHGESSHGRGYDNVSLDSGASVVVKDSFNQIDKADVVFAWIENNTAYGTLVEIGYAVAKALPVWLAFESKFFGQLNTDPSGGHGDWRTHDLWFAAEAAGGSRHFPTAKEALASFLPQIDEGARRARLLAGHSNNLVMVLRGIPDPQHHDYVASLYAPDGSCKLGRRLALIPNWGNSPKHLPLCCSQWCWPETETFLGSALSAARSARFEHGETPA